MPRRGFPGSGARQAFETGTCHMASEKGRFGSQSPWHASRPPRPPGPLPPFVFSFGKQADLAGQVVTALF